MPFGKKITTTSMSDQEEVSTSGWDFGGVILCQKLLISVWEAIWEAIVEQFGVAICAVICVAICVAFLGICHKTNRHVVR